MGKTTPVFQQVSYAGRCDNGSQTAATWKYADGTCGDSAANATNRPWTQLVDTNFRVRITVAETAGGAENNKSFKFQAKLNTGSWFDVTTSSTIVKAVATSGFADGDDTTQQISSGTYITDNDGCCEDGVISGVADFVSNRAEYELSCQIVGTDVADNDTVYIQMVATSGEAITTYSNTPSMTVDKPITPSIDQQSFRGRNDNGTETTATWKANANVNWSQNVDENFRVRFLLQEDNGGVESNFTAQLQYNLNSGGWNNVTGASNVVRASASPNVTDGADCTQQIGSGTFITNNDGFDEVDGASGGANLDFAGSDEVEVEFCVQIRSADVANNDTVQLRIAGADTWTNTPSITVIEATPQTIGGDNTGGIAGTGEVSYPSITNEEYWWDQGFLYRKKITFSVTGVTVGQVQIPVFVKLNTSRIDVNIPQSTFQDLRFVSSNNTTQLPHEVVHVDKAGNTEIHVRVDAITPNTSGNYFWMYYGNKAVADGQDAANVWSNGYVSVHHFDDPSGTQDNSEGTAALDATYDGTATVQFEQTSEMGQAVDCPGLTGGGFYVAQNDAYNGVNYTIEAYARIDGAGQSLTSGSGGVGGYPITTRGHGEVDTQGQNRDVHHFMVVTSDGNWNLAMDYEDATSSGNDPLQGGTTLSNNGTTYYHLCIRHDNTLQQDDVFVNGTNDGTQTNTNTPATGSDIRVGIGTSYYSSLYTSPNSPSGGFAGVIDELRYSNVARHDDWILLSAKSMRDLLLTYGSEERILQAHVS